MGLSSLTDGRHPLQRRADDRGLIAALESGVNENVETEFPGAEVQVGGTRRGENPVLPDEAGGEFNKFAGR